MKKAVPYPSEILKGEKSQRCFSGANAIQVAMPIGGIGAGCICLNGSGGFQDFSIRGKPLTSAAPDGHRYIDAAFAALHIKGDNPITRIIESTLPKEKIYSFGLKAQGFRQGGHEGLPRFENAEFKGEYPFGHVRFSDPKIPLNVSLKAFNPFIPRDDKNSSIPCAILEYTFENRSVRKIDFEFSFHLSHPLGGHPSARNSVIPNAGVFLSSQDNINSENFCSASLIALSHKPRIKGMWFRGGWFDSISVLWRELSTGSFKTNGGSNGVDTTGHNGGSILIEGSLRPKASVTYPIVITWYFPNRNETFGLPPEDKSKCACAPPAEGELPPPQWRPFYASQWGDAREVALYVKRYYRSLRDRTQAFHDALFSSTLPSYVLDAVSSNLAIIKSPTVLRQANGNMWAFEGCMCDKGCCPGSCTHVWNYAQAVPHLFPQLERTLREQELVRSMDDRGHITFRAALPDGPTTHQFHAASDGQLGGIMKLYRDWQISADRDWLERLYPPAKKSMNYCIEAWDPNRLGVLVEPHHNTYDIEFWGPDGMCSSFYLAALAALSQMGRELGFTEEAEFYDDLSRRGAKYLDDHLFNGEYYFQEVLYDKLRDKSFLDMISKVDAKSSEVMQLLKREGPKYQYGIGCISDGVIGAWMAKIYGIDTPQNAEHVRRNLQAIFEYNFRDDLFEHANPQRPGYALGHEPGLLLCTWPNGGRPTLPFVYSDEVWTGIEYQVASHLIEEGFVDEGLTLVRAVRQRYDGHVRNPWNEYECGSYYARAMASYSLLGSLAGMRYSKVTKTLWFAPKLQRRSFRVFFSGADGYGVISLDGDQLKIELTEGHLSLERVVVTRKGKTFEVRCKKVAKAGKPLSIPIRS